MGGEKWGWRGPQGPVKVGVGVWVLGAALRRWALPALIVCVCAYTSLSLSPFQSQEEKQALEPQDPQQRGQLREHPSSAALPAPVRALPPLLLRGTRALPALHPSGPQRDQLLLK